MQVIIKSKITDETRTLDTERVAIRNAWPMAEQNVSLRKSPTTEKFITGYDLEYGESKEKILADKKHAKYALMQELDEIEKALGVSLDGDKDNEFLLNLRLPLCLRNGGEVKLNLTKPRDKFYYKALIASGYVAPDKESLYEPKYTGSLYFFSKPKADESSRQLVSKLKNEIGAKLTVYSENKVWLLAISLKLGLPTGSELSKNLLYIQIDDYKNKLTKLSDAEKLVKIMNSAPEDLEYDFITEVGNKFGIITITPDKARMLDGVVLGGSIDEVKNNLKLDRYIDSYVALRNKVYQKYNIQ